MTSEQKLAEVRRACELCTSGLGALRSAREVLQRAGAYRAATDLAKGIAAAGRVHNLLLHNTENNKETA